MRSLSIVVPYYKKLKELSIVLPRNVCFVGRPDVELVLVLDEPSQEQEVLALLDQFPMVAAKVLVNDQSHEWRPPCIALNVGIRASKGDFVLVVSPECVFVGDVVSRVIDILRGRPSDVLLGRVTWASFAEAEGRGAEELFQDSLAARGQGSYSMDYYGSIAASRNLFNAVCGYDEALRLWGGDDDNLRARMSMHGALLMLDRRLNFVHLSTVAGRSAPSVPGHNFLQARALVNPTSVRANHYEWGVEFGRVARDRT
jgi:hypothetical protein